MCLSTRFLRINYVSICLVPYMLLENIELQKLKNGILSFFQKNLPFFSSCLSCPFLFHSVHFYSDFKTTVRFAQFVNQTWCLTHNTDQCDSRQHPLTNFLPSHSPVSKMSQEAPESSACSQNFALK